MNNFKLIPIIALSLFIGACKTTKNNKVVELPPVTITPEDSIPRIYHGSNTISHELVHTWLDVSFDWNKSYLYGKAVITLQPHFYPTDFLWLDARGMEILDLRLLNGNDSLKIKYIYANDSLGITLDKVYKKGEQFRIYVKYIAKPDELKDISGARAITSDKGLYFINPLGLEPGKPRQIWTQGETNANSVWFPTIDSPNQKMTQEISMTVDSNYVTLSNGLLIKSINNNNGTRTDTWKQTLPHAPYLTMMTVGDFAIVKDKWRNIAVDYYVEPKYKNVAMKIFGNTPEMIEYFSTILGVDYPWEKYDQIVVRDYVSGSMENTTATLHGEFLQRDERQLIDETSEEYISHELFHQWFGDLITCESYANIPLNESFASYGEYLWNEHKYGREYADYYHLKDLNNYLRAAKTKQVDLIRFYYDDKMDMFDRNSYEKGACVLHMLRKEVGDDAFFASLNRYLETNKFKTVEIHNLRLAFEYVTGTDMNWFFNEWFLNKGHPNLNIDYAYNPDTKTASITIEQLQDLTTTPLYTLPMNIDIYSDDSITREKIKLTEKKQTFTFSSTKKPDLINTDAEKMLLCVKKDNHTTEEWIFMYRNGKLWQDRFEAVQALSLDYNAGTPAAKVLMDAMNDQSFGIRKYAVNKCEVNAKSSDSLSVKKILMALASTDPNSSVRDEALSSLGEYFKGDDLTVLYGKMTTDSSYAVSSTALLLLAENDQQAAMKMAKGLESNDQEEIRSMLAELYSDYGNDDQAAYMSKMMDDSKEFDIYTNVQSYGKFLKRCNNEKNINSGLKQIYTAGKTAEPWYVRLSASRTLADLGNYFGDKIKTAEKQNDPESATKYTNIRDLATKYLDEIKTSEKNEKLQKIYSNGK